MNWLLVDPPFRVHYQKHIIPHLGIALLAARLRQHGHSVAVWSGSSHGRPLATFRRTLRAVRPDVVGFSAPTSKITQAARLAACVREALPGARTVLGGWHVSAVPAQTLSDFPVFDLALVGEAEDSILELAVALERGSALSAVRGLVWRQGGQVVVNEPHPPPPDLDQLPDPAWDLLALEHTVPMYRRVAPGEIDYPLATRRGCPYSCLFCQQEGVTQIRTRSLDAVMAELDTALGRYNVTGVQFFDDTFTLSASRTAALCAAFTRERHLQRLGWNCATRVDRVDRDLLALMKASGCRVIQFGLEAGSQRVLDANRKGTTLEQGRRALAWCRELGLRTDVSFMFGMPYDTRASVHETARFALSLDADFVSFFSFIPYPGTPAARLAARGEANLRMLHERHDDYEQQFSVPVELQDMAAWRLLALRMWAYVRFYLRPSKIDNLLAMFDVRSQPAVIKGMLYSTWCRLIGAGRRWGE